MCRGVLCLGLFINRVSKIVSGSINIFLMIFIDYHFFQLIFIGVTCLKYGEVQLEWAVKTR